MTYFKSWTRSGAAVVVLCLLLPLASATVGQDPARAAKADSKGHPSFGDTDAIAVLEKLRRALESNNSGRFLKTFDAKRMPGYAAFRDQVAEFFGRYDAFVVRYHLTQISMDGEFGAALADFEFDASPRDGVTPNVRQHVQLRLVCGWDGRQWRIVDLSPRSWLE
jgi:hypothetical protein